MGSAKGATRGKADAGPPTGAKLLRALAARSPVPLVAIGGITAGNAGEAIRAGTAGVAVITAVVAADDIAAAARRMRDEVRAARQG